jgi:hypothetical protein
VRGLLFSLDNATRTIICGVAERRSIEGIQKNFGMEYNNHSLT